VSASDLRLPGNDDSPQVLLPNDFHGAKASVVQAPNLRIDRFQTIVSALPRRVELLDIPPLPLPEDRLKRARNGARLKGSFDVPAPLLQQRLVLLGARRTVFIAVDKEPACFKARKAPREKSLLLLSKEMMNSRGADNGVDWTGVVSPVILKSMLDGRGPVAKGR
jgi:hypothetical protein